MKVSDFNKQSKDLKLSSIETSSSVFGQSKYHSQAELGIKGSTINIHNQSQSSNFTLAKPHSIKHGNENITMSDEYSVE